MKGSNAIPISPQIGRVYIETPFCIPYTPPRICFVTSVLTRVASNYRRLPDKISGEKYESTCLCRPPWHESGGFDGEAITTLGGKRMALNRYVTEMGMGADVHGKNYTKAAKRAVSDAIRHSSLNFFRALDKSPDDMRITVHIGVGNPDAIDKEAVAAELPYGKVTVEPVLGGLEVPNEDGSDSIIIANAAVVVCFDE